MAVSAGRILILPKGSYDSTTTYEFLDAVYYQGSTYICKKTALNVLPSNTEYWQIMAQGTASASVAGNYYAECDTSASTPAKVITVPATEYFVLQVGDIVNVKFTYTNTAINPTLNINNTGNKPIVYDTSAITSSNLWAGGEAGRITSFMYDGTNWVWISHDVDTNTIADLLDTSISSPSNKQGLIFNGTSNKWENKSLVAGDVIFDNTGTDLVSNNVNDSIVEVNDKKVNKSGDTMSGDLTIVSKGTAETVGISTLILGNNIPRYTDENSLGRIDIYGYEQYRTRLYAASLTADRNIELPDESGTLALNSETTATSGTITKSSYATALYQAKVHKLGNLVFISCAWSGSANNLQEIATVPSGFRPSSETVGSGMVISPNGTVGGIYTITSTGVIKQGTTTGSATGGTFSFIFTV